MVCGSSLSYLRAIKATATWQLYYNTVTNSHFAVLYVPGFEGNPLYTFTYGKSTSAKLALKTFFEPSKSFLNLMKLWDIRQDF